MDADNHNLPNHQSPIINHQSTITVGLISLGCAKNLVDSQIMAGVLLGDGFTIAAEPETADIILVNTCSFIGDAREESIDAILSACALRGRGRCRGVVVTGCLPQRYRRELQESLPEVDAFVGLDSLGHIAAVVRRVAAGGRGIADVATQARRLFEPAMPGLSLTGGPYAYLKIAEGCNHPCAFCAIPSIRGRYRSRSVSQIVREAEALLEAGFRELNLISQDTTHYGSDLARADLPRLLRALGKLGGEFWIRLLYSYPSRVSRALLDAMAEVPQVCRYLDVPIQHSHPDVLRCMRRANTIAPLRALAGRVRAALPDAALRTTCLVGFPGETERHFQHLLAFIEAAAFDHLGAFAFSPEEGTPAEALRPRPRRATAEARRDRLLRLQRKLVRRKAVSLVGSECRALLERPSGTRGEWLARTPRQAPEVDGMTRVTNVPRAAAAGDFIRVRITAPAGYDLVAVAV